LWRWNFVHHLLWEALPEGTFGRSFTGRPSKYRPPSWSWESIDGDIIPWDPLCSLYADYHVFAEVSDVRVTTVDNNPIEHIQNASLKIRAPFVEASKFIDK
jgi:hypothetical protein